MLKKLIVIFIIFCACTWLGLFYLNTAVLPVKIKALIIKDVQDFTGKNASCEEVKLSIFKGLVVRGFNLYDNKKIILSVKEINCTFLFLPLIKKQVIIPRLNIVSPTLFLERRLDNTFNVLKPFKGSDPVVTANNKFNLIIYGISVSQAKISFQDDMINPVFTKEVQNLKVNLSLALPAKVKFVFSGQVPAHPAMKLAGQGEYNISAKSFSAKVGLKDFIPSEFEPYLSGQGLSFGKGKVDYLGNLYYKDQVISSDFTLQTRGISVTRDKLLFVLNSTTKASFKYGFNEKHWDFSGKTDISEGFCYGLPNLEQIDKISGQVRFNNEGIFSDNLTAYYAQIPFKANITVVNFKKPLLSADLSVFTGLADIQKLAKNNFRLELPCAASGQAGLRVKIESGFDPAGPAKAGPAKIEGSLSVAQAKAFFPKYRIDINSIDGDIKFTSEKILWEGLGFRFLDTVYKSSGSIQGFVSPQVDLSINSEKSQLDASFKAVSQVIDFSRLAGRYLNSDFSLLGKVDLTDPNQPMADIFGKINLELSELSKQLKKLKVNLGQSTPGGLVNIQGQLKGGLNDIKNCQIKATLASTYLWLYGLRVNNLSADFLLTNAVADAESLHFSLYGGTIDAKATMNLKDKSMPYWLDAAAQKVDIARLKADTAMKGKNISGLLSADLKLSGLWDNLSKLSGSGKVSITDGSFWELDLFKGVGTLLFSNDFRDIVFSDGSCNFVIRDRSIYSDDIKLQGSLCLMKGRAKIGFDSKVDAELNVEVSPDAPLTGTLKDFTTTILGNASHFGAISITGTLKEPKFKFKAAVTNIIQGIADTFLRRE